MSYNLKLHEVAPNLKWVSLLDSLKDKFELHTKYWVTLHILELHGRLMNPDFHRHMLLLRLEGYC